MNKTEITEKVEKDILNYFGAKTLLSNNKKLMELCIESTLTAINYTHSCTAESEQLVCDTCKSEVSYWADLDRWTCNCGRKIKAK